MQQNAYLISLISGYLKLMGASFHEDELKLVLHSSPSFPSTLSIVQACLFFNLKTGAYRTNSISLPKVEMPVIAHLKTTETEKFILLKKVSGDRVSYYDASIYKSIESSLDEFCEKWTGIIILSEKTENGCYNQKRLSGNTIFRWILFSILVFCISFYGLKVTKDITLLLFTTGTMTLKFIGLWLSIALIRHKTGHIYPVIDALCHKNESFDCDKVIQSKASKLFNTVALADVGFVYFTWGIIALLLGLFSNLLNWVLVVYFYISACCTPFILFSIIYQKVIIKKWCFLCLSVMGVIFLENILFLFYEQKMIPSSGIFLTITLVILSLVSSIIALRWMKKTSKNHSKLSYSTTIQLKLKRNPIIIEAIFKRQILTPLKKHNALIVGDTQTPITITTLLRPFCTPCKNIALQVIEIIERYPDLIQWHIRLDGVGRSEYDNINKVQLLLIELFKRESTTKIKLQIFREWFKEQNLEFFTKKNVVTSISAETTRFFYQQIEDNQLLSTDKVPSVWINDRFFPPEYSIEDLPFLLLHTTVRTNNIGKMPDDS